MPNYCYKCYECGDIEEVFHSMNENPEILCKICKTVKKRIIKSCSVILPVNFNPDDL